MASMPSVARVVFDGQSRSLDPSVLRTEMERGVPKQRVENSQVLMKQSMTLYFTGMEAVLAFEDWYFDDIGRIDWFTMDHPFTGQVITARFEGGALGQLAPDEKEAGDYRMDVVVEYLR
ncbi:hypothetical protein [Stenotrophomonas sp.]|uniref:hypothetical protein n=1 Tax=Stenotrophomonas sp. TaxID=69392 RepID=UPI0028A6B317|nr:hypothetical protein [Stenotrophomonas sp.]